MYIANKEEKLDEEFVDPLRECTCDCDCFPVLEALEGAADSFMEAY